MRHGVEGESIQVRDVTKRFAAGPPILDGIRFDVPAGSFVSIVGRSGCGKSTMLNILAGLLLPSSGQVLVGGAPVSGPGLDRGMVFQHASLFPWLTAAENIAFGPRNQGAPKPRRDAMTAELIELVRLTGYEQRYPSELSGGMQQRVAIARALALDPGILLMDEPFGALDELTREDMQHELLRIWTERRKTVVFVTHSISEAIFLSDTILVFGRNPGRIVKSVQVGLPRPRPRVSEQVLRLHELVYSALD